MIRSMVFLYMRFGTSAVQFAATHIRYYLGHRRVIEGVDVGSSSTFVDIASVASCLYTTAFVHQNVESEAKNVTQRGVRLHSWVNRQLYR